ncbi:MAG TPA: hypothetical protein VFB68_03695 [Xanthobacteraceae bacterium]|nr:hypothetical protein [Xanthobacteraceae bacterium]
MQRANNFRLGTHQSVAYTRTAGTIANAFGAGTWAVRVVCTTAAFVKIGSSPTATSGDVYLPADKPEIFIVNPGEKASAIQVASGGTLHVTELA